MDRVLLCLVVLGAISCGGSAPQPAPVRPDAAATGPAYDPAVIPPVNTAPRLVVLGDSLTAGLGLPRDQAYPTLLQQKLKDNGHAIEVVNAGVSGDTSADGLRRVNWAIDGNIRLLIVALGANDGLRGLPADQMKKNLKGIIDRARQRGIPVLLAGMEAPPNYGERYASEFRQVYRDLARENGVVLVPFLLDGVAGVPDLNQSDGIHPSAAGAARIAEGLWPAVEKMMNQGR